MIKILILVLSLISSPVLAETQTMTADSASSTQFASELVFCSFFFLEVSQCFADKNFTRRLSPQDKKQAAGLSRTFSKEASKATTNVSNIAKANVMPPIDFSGIALRSVKSLNAEIDGSCANINILLDKYGPGCKRLVNEPLLRLKELSECPNEGKVGC